jgi:hypothetical protein
MRNAENAKMRRGGEEDQRAYDLTRSTQYLSPLSRRLKDEKAFEPPLERRFLPHRCIIQKTTPAILCADASGV